jgi:hypothetical protein
MSLVPAGDRSPIRRLSSPWAVSISNELSQLPVAFTVMFQLLAEVLICVVCETTRKTKM